MASGAPALRLRSNAAPQSPPDRSALAAHASLNPIIVKREK